MDQVLTDQIFRFICEFSDQNGYPPSQREIAKACYLSRTGVVTYLDNLEDQGRIIRAPRAARGIRVIRDPQQPANR